MRGLPPLQAAVLLATLAILGLLGSSYIDMGAAVAPSTPTSEEASNNGTTKAEVELVFSSVPLSYTLSKPSVSGGKDIVVLQSSSPVDNPSYGDVSLSSHHHSSYWLDVVWSADAREGSRHFVQVHISPSHGEEQRLSFFSSTQEMNETFDYHMERNHDE